MIKQQVVLFLCIFFLTCGLGFVFYKTKETQTSLQLLTQKYTNLEISMYKPPPSTEDLLKLYNNNDDTVEFLSEDED
jgi:hypothetical protein